MVSIISMVACLSLLFCSWSLPTDCEIFCLSLVGDNDVVECECTRRTRALSSGDRLELPRDQHVMNRVQSGRIQSRDLLGRLQLVP